MAGVGPHRAETRARSARAGDRSRAGTFVDHTGAIGPPPDRDRSLARYDPPGPEESRRAGVTVPQVQCRVQALPFRSGSFDSVVSTFPTDYIADRATLREVQRVTNEQGRLIVVVGAQLIGRAPSKVFIEWLYRITGQRDTKFDEESIFDQLRNARAH